VSGALRHCGVGSWWSTDGPAGGVNAVEVEVEVDLEAEIEADPAAEAGDLTA
jgi:hypothetical protein